MKKLNRKTILLATVCVINVICLTIASIIAFANTIGKKVDTSIGVSRMQIAKKPDKLSYLEGDKFDPTGLSLVVVYDNGESAAIDKDYTWDLTDGLKEEDDEVKITYRNRSVVLEINVKAKVATSLKVVNEDLPTVYSVGTKFLEYIPSGLKVEATYEDGSTEIVTEGFSLSPRGALSFGTTVVKITYKKATVEVPVYVDIAKVEELTIGNMPSKTKYSAGEYPDLKGLKLVAKLDNGIEAETIDYYYEKEPFEKDDDKITISYGGKTVEIPIEVVENDKVFTIDKMPTKTTYTEGEAFDPTGLEIALDGVTTDDYTVVGGDNLELGSVVKAVLNSDENVFVEIPIIVSTEETDITTNNLVSGTAKDSIDGSGYLKPYVKNGKYLGDFSDGATLEVTVNSKSFTKANISLKAASNWRTRYEVGTWYPSEVKSLQANAWIAVYVNGVEVRIDSSVRVGADGSSDNPRGDIYLLALYRNIELNNVDLREGENTIRIVVNARTDIMSASTTINGVKNNPIAAGIYIDTLTVKTNAYGICVASDKFSYDETEHWHECVDCGKIVGEKVAHSFTEKIAKEEYLEKAASCEGAATYYKSCVCGAKGTETFAYGEALAHEAETEATCTKKAVCKICKKEFGDFKPHEAETEATCTKKAVCKICGNEYGDFKPHDYETIAEDGEHYRKCRVCDYETAHTTDHIYTAGTATEKDGVQTLVLTCPCGHSETRTLNQTDANYKNITADNLKGKNTIAWASGGYAGRTSAIVQKGSSSANVQKAENASYNKDYVNYLYGGSRIEVELNATKDTKASFVVKASSGWIQQVNWGANASKTGDMVFNKVFKAYIRHADGTVSEIEISDDVVLKGATGGYEIMANWTYVAFTDVDVKEGDVFVLESLTPKTEDGKYLYWDGQTSPKTAADKSVSVNETQSSPTLDTIAVYYDE